MCSTYFVSSIPIVMMLHRLEKKGVVFSELANTGIPIADGFVISKEAFDAFLRENNLKTKIDHLLKTLDHRHPESILQVSSLIKKNY